MEQNKSLGLLSLARKGGNIVLGEEQAGAAARTSARGVMLLASDAGATPCGGQRASWPGRRSRC